MNIDEVLDNIEKGIYSNDPRVSIPEPFENDAGSIWNIARGTFGSATFIKSKAGSVRSNHYHQTDSHFIYLISGLMYYYWRPANSDGPCRRIRVEKSQLIFTPPMVAHATYFPVESQVVTLNKYARDKAHHEADVVRIPALVTTEVCPSVAEGIKCCLPFETTRDHPVSNIHCAPHESIAGHRYNFGMFGGQDA